MRNEALRALQSSAIPRSPQRGVFALRLSERKLLLALVDLICVNFSLAAAISVRYQKPLKWAPSHQLMWHLVLTAIWIVMTTLLGSYDLRRAARPRSGAAVAAVTSSVVAVTYLFIPYITPPLPTARMSLLFFIGTMVAAVTIWRVFYAFVLVKAPLRRKALVVGAGWAGQTIGSIILQNAAAGYELVGFVDDDPARQGETIAGLAVLGTGENLENLVKETGVSEIIIAITGPDQMRPEVFQAIMNCYECGVEVTQMPVLFEQLTGRVPVEHAGRNLYVVLPPNGYPSHLQRSVKRLFDLAIGLAGLVLTVLLLPVVWLFLQIENRGPVFYKQARVGRGGRVFDVIKFRTMVVDAEADGPRWADERDPRVTRIGLVLRRLHLDEVPQAINILRGEMSFIGPRPERPEFVEQLERQIPFYRARHAVRPGVTGWAQVNFRYGASVEDALIKLQHDLYYIRHQSVWLDLLIIIKTVGLVLTLKGR